MKKLDPRLAFGLLLVAGGVLLLLQTMGWLEGATSLFWGVLFIAAGLAFFPLLLGGHWWAAFPAFNLAVLGGIILLPAPLGRFAGPIFLAGIGLSFWVVYLTARTARWWALIPAGILTALAAAALVADAFQYFGGAIFLGGIGLSFAVVYLTDRTARWWALIPAGVLLTLAGVTLAPRYLGSFQTTGFFFLGLAVTFLLVALLAQMRWAYLPALILALMGALGFASLLDMINDLWALVLIAAGIFILFFSNRSRT